MKIAKSMIAALALFVVSCGDHRNDDVVEPVFMDSDVVGATGTRIRYPAGSLVMPTIGWVEAVYVRTMDCAGLYASGTLISYEDIGDRIGVYNPYYRVITINISYAWNADVLAHEFIHYLRHANNLSWSHIDTPEKEFLKCAPSHMFLS